MQQERVFDGKNYIAPEVQNQSQDDIVIQQGIPVNLGPGVNSTQSSIISPQQQQNNQIEAKIRQIDNKLKESGYLCYKYWMWFVFVYGAIVIFFSLLAAMGGFVDLKSIILQASHIAASRLMILAYRDKISKKAKIGTLIFSLSIIPQVIMVPMLSEKMYEETMKSFGPVFNRDQMIVVIIFQIIIVILCNYFFNVYGGRKVRRLLEEREALCEDLNTTDSDFRHL